ncbi:hypothetical protein TRFO_19622 [Tritrichomonas foetus]|uniref:BTB domain-containing protein n=1 Tax=Tritrichomonas foetus TaxID=1144522 RepID=A0A1J4KNG3_9EUKA|nr:hypothetical protein TRFO_19622 [Tritrichomonas foetus]|eukprot:OHT10933.1 hypothetical protein TRFO_19622 [Tritrichomonas foetus]
MAALESENKLQYRFYDYWKRKIFIDCHIITGHDTIPCHRLILAKNSRYFFQIICSNDKEVKEIEIKFDPGNNLKHVIEYLYSGTIEINQNNLIQFAAIAYYYQIESLISIVDLSLIQFMKKENAIYFLKQCKKLNFNKFNQKFADFFIDVINCMNNEEKQETEHGNSSLLYNLNILNSKKELKIQNIIKYADSELVSLLLNGLPEMPIEEKISTLDLFASYQTSLDSTDQEFLTKVIDFTDENSYKFFIKFKCDWVTNEIQRSMISTILTRRREHIKYYENNLENPNLSIQNSNQFPIQTQDQTLPIGRWSAFAKLTKIFYVDEGCEQFDMIEFIRTLGGSIHPINPVKFGFLNIFHTRPLANIFGGMQIFEEKRYFASNKINSVFPSIEFTFGPKEHFLIHSICLDDVEPVSKTDWKVKKPHSGKTLVSLFRQNSTAFEANLPRPFQENEIGSNSPASVIRLTMVEPNSSGGWIFRFSFPHLIGSFV